MLDVLQIEAEAHESADDQHAQQIEPAVGDVLPGFD